MPEVPAAAALSPVTAGEAMRALASALRRAHVPTPDLDARLLVMLACGFTREDIVIERDSYVTADQIRMIAEFQARRIAREPVSRIAGEREFWGRPFLINRATLDPRPDSETLVETVLHIVDAEGWRDRPLRILDLGTGSGCLLLSLLAELPRATGCGADISADALAAAAGNAARMNLSGRAVFTLSDWVETVDGRYDIIISNPPYIPAEAIETLAPEVRTYDPRAALDGGVSGLDAYRTIGPQLGRVSAAEAWAVFETGAAQHADVLHILGDAGFHPAPAIRNPVCDLAGLPRVVAGKRQKSRA